MLWSAPGRRARNARLPPPLSRTRGGLVCVIAGFATHLTPDWLPVRIDLCGGFTASSDDDLA